ncbi:hypothetical protein TWF718_003056 [Orbilia javanica]|uniref:Vacuolar ATPase assembly protein VMA22 n=1 Tax=Orbilia javanica TaxID=47235 RepID=A0AAN8RAK0_9PEZI
MATQQALDDLQDKLDNLIISYLDLFDEYQSSRTEISRNFSEGFLNLAQANFNAPNRVRYGQDMYDNRMQALRGVHIAVDETDVTAYTLKDLTSPPKATTPEKADLKPPPSTDDANPDPTKEKTSEITTDQGDSDKPDTNSDDAEVALKLANSKTDPLRWFGILRPMTLGTAQKNFVHSLPPIMKLVSTLSDIEYHEKVIRDLRQKVRGMRKELGIKIDDGSDGEPAAMPELDKLTIGGEKSTDETAVDNSLEDEKQREEEVEKALRDE